MIKKTILYNLRVAKFSDPFYLVIGHWSLVIGHWSLVICHWSLVIGHWSLVIPFLYEGA
ncbi:hypothetical protein [Nodularia spumigena]|uniref:hypothetical protein n=1 Tax=Nodularia spumigena TaxID=70799 RepID=UPI00131F058A|nr:hypothetical protein [Nodularia spumigena]